MSLAVPSKFAIRIITQDAEGQPIYAYPLLQVSGEFATQYNDFFERVSDRMRLWQASEYDEKGDPAVAGERLTVAVSMSTGGKFSAAVPVPREDGSGLYDVAVI